MMAVNKPRLASEKTIIALTAIEKGANYMPNSQALVTVRASGTKEQRVKKQYVKAGFEKPAATIY
jgi:hypothetical protein